MTNDRAELAIINRLRTGYQGALPVYSVDPNAKTRKPVGGGIAVRTTWGKRVQRANGTDSICFEEPGAVSIGVLVPEGAGSGLARRERDAIQALFFRQSDVVDGAVIDYLSTRNVNDDREEDQFHRYGLVVSFVARGQQQIDRGQGVAPGSDERMRGTWPGHGFDGLSLPAPGYWLGSDPRPAQADGDGSRAADFVVTWVSGDNVELATSGFVTLAHSLGAPGPRYLSQTATGELVEALPVEGVTQRVLQVLSSTRLQITIDPPRVR